MKQYLICSLLIATLAYSSCKKSAATKDESPLPVTPTTGSRIELSLDSLYLYAYQTYLWYDALPGYEQFRPRRYANYSNNSLQCLKKALFDLVQYKINPTTSKPYEYEVSTNQGKYSFVEEGNTTSGREGTVNLEGTGDDFGLELAVVNGQDVRVRYVNTASPAAKAGITRGCRILLINNAPASTSTTALNSALTQSSIALAIKRPDGSTFNANLIQDSYASSPVLKTSLITSGGKTIGYISFARFSAMNNAQKGLDSAFDIFATAGIENIVVDLRYNGGGYVETSEYFANLLAPPSVSGSMMYAEYFNDLMQQGKASILKSIPYLENGQPRYINGHPATYADVDYSVKGNTRNFSKKGPLQTVKNIAFIVSSSTASASELLINSLKPYLNVQLIGTKTYGKPVGFFGIGIDKYTVYLSQFKSINARGQGDYFDGLTPGIIAADDVTHDFGDTNEISLSKAIAWIEGGAIPSGGRMVVNGNKVEAASVTVENSRTNEFNGMVESGSGLHLQQ